MTVNMSPHDVRVAARSLTYPNRLAEDENLRRIDGEVWERVAEFERGVVETARSHMEKGERIATDAVDALATLRTQFTEVATNGDVSRQMLREFQDVRRRAESLARSLDVAERDAAWHIGRCNDIYGSWLALVDKYPTLKPAIRLQ